MLPVIEHAQGNTFLYDILIEVNGAGIDVSAWSLSMTVKSDLDLPDDQSLFHLTTADATLDMTDAPSGRIVARVEPAVTQSAPLGEYQGEIKVKDTEGLVQSRRFVFHLCEKVALTPL